MLIHYERVVVPCGITQMPCRPSELEFKLTGAYACHYFEYAKTSPYRLVGILGLLKLAVTRNASRDNRCDLDGFILLSFQRLPSLVVGANERNLLHDQRGRQGKIDLEVEEITQVQSRSSKAKHDLQVPSHERTCFPLAFQIYMASHALLHRSVQASLLHKFSSLKSMKIDLRSA